jgi:glycosyltransferase involved in cell wall biosynthesis
MFRRRSYIKNNYPRKLLTVSSYFPGKGLTEFISVLENLSNTDWEWILVGEDKLDPDFLVTLNDRLNKSSIKDKIQIIGPVSDEKLRKFYQNSDIFLLPSRFETCSMVTMEAMAAGLPIIAFNTGGLSEIIHDNLNGYLLSAFDEHNFSSSIQELLLNDDLRQKMGQESFQISATFPSWRESSIKFSGFLNNLNLAVNTD